MIWRWGHGTLFVVAFDSSHASWNEAALSDGRACTRQSAIFGRPDFPSDFWVKNVLRPPYVKPQDGLSRMTFVSLLLCVIESFVDLESNHFLSESRTPPIQRQLKILSLRVCS